MKNMTKVMGYTVRIGSKKHQILLQQKRIFDQNAAGEQGMGRN